MFFWDLKTHLVLIKIQQFKNMQNARHHIHSQFLLLYIFAGYSNVYLDYMYEQPITDEPDKNVDEIEADGVCPEEDVGCETGERPGQHALGDWLQQRRVRHHGRPEFYPSEIMRKINKIFRS